MVTRDVTHQPVLRPLQASDSLANITSLLNRSYAKLATMGLNYTAVDQTEAITASRVARGQCYVLEDVGQIIGTITVNGPFNPTTDPWARATPWYYRQDIAHLHQFAVEPSRQGEGLGHRLVDAVEAWAREHGYRAIALDTAMPATHLRALYAKRGYQDMDNVQWGGKTYRSVVMVKALVTPEPTVDDAEHQWALALVTLG
jgi:GNAT superfamily N-acetyltransferase